MAGIAEVNGGLGVGEASDARADGCTRHLNAPTEGVVVEPSDERPGRGGDVAHGTQVVAGVVVLEQRVVGLAIHLPLRVVEPGGVLVGNELLLGQDEAVPNEAESSISRKP